MTKNYSLNIEPPIWDNLPAEVVPEELKELLEKNLRYRLGPDVTPDDISCVRRENPKTFNLKNREHDRDGTWDENSHPAHSPVTVLIKDIPIAVIGSIPVVIPPNSIREEEQHYRSMPLVEYNLLMMQDIGFAIRDVGSGREGYDVVNGEGIEFDKLPEAIRKGSKHPEKPKGTEVFTSLADFISKIQRKFDLAKGSSPTYNTRGTRGSLTSPSHVKPNEPRKIMQQYGALEHNECFLTRPPEAVKSVGITLNMSSQTIQGSIDMAEKAKQYMQQDPKCQQLRRLGLIPREIKYFAYDEKKGTKTYVTLEQLKEIQQVVATEERKQEDQPDRNPRLLSARDSQYEQVVRAKLASLPAQPIEPPLPVAAASKAVSVTGELLNFTETYIFKKKVELLTECGLPDADIKDIISFELAHSQLSAKVTLSIEAQDLQGKTYKIPLVYFGREIFPLLPLPEDIQLKKDSLKIIVTNHANEQTILKVSHQSDVQYYTQHRIEIPLHAHSVSNDTLNAAVIFSKNLREKVRTAFAELEIKVYCQQPDPIASLSQTRGSDLGATRGLGSDTAEQTITSIGKLPQPCMYGIATEPRPTESQYVGSMKFYMHYMSVPLNPEDAQQLIATTLQEYKKHRDPNFFSRSFPLETSTEVFFKDVKQQITFLSDHGYGHMADAYRCDCCKITVSTSDSKRDGLWKSIHKTQATDSDQPLGENDFCPDCVTTALRAC